MVKGDSRHAWNKGKHGIYTEETRRRIGIAASKKKNPVHKQRIAESMKKIKICSQCSIKSSRWIFKILIPAVHETIPLDLCEQCTINQFQALSPKDKRAVQVLS